MAPPVECCKKVDISRMEFFEDYTPILFDFNIGHFRSIVGKRLQ